MRLRADPFSADALAAVPEIRRGARHAGGTGTLAGTFSILGLIPFVALIELGFIIAFGVLLDTLLVRSVIVPALVWDVGPRVWWPSALARDGGSGRRRLSSSR